MSVADHRTLPWQKEALFPTWADLVASMSDPEEPHGCEHREDRLCVRCCDAARKRWDGARRKVLIEMLFMHQWVASIISCAYCLAPLDPDGLTLDHVLPISRGGSNDFCNLTFACGPCNLRKGRK